MNATQLAICEAELDAARIDATPDVSGSVSSLACERLDALTNETLANGLHDGMSPAEIARIGNLYGTLFDDYCDPADMSLATQLAKSMASCLRRLAASYASETRFRPPEAISTSGLRQRPR